MNTENTIQMNISEVVEVKNQPGRPVIEGSKRQLLLKKKQMLKDAGVVEAGRPINIEETEKQISILQEKVRLAKLRMEIEKEIDMKLGLS